MVPEELSHEFQRRPLVSALLNRDVGYFAIAIILITTPIIFPVMIELGINPVWYGILLMINLELALITPPVGMNLFVIKGIAKATMGEIIRGILPYVVLLLAGLVIVLLFPQTAMWLPDIAGFGR